MNKQKAAYSKLLARTGVLCLPVPPHAPPLVQSPCGGKGGSTQQFETTAIDREEIYNSMSSFLSELKSGSKQWEIARRCSTKDASKTWASKDHTHDRGVTEDTILLVVTLLSVTLLSYCCPSGLPLWLLAWLLQSLSLPTWFKVSNCSSWLLWLCDSIWGLVLSG